MAIISNNNLFAARLQQYCSYTENQCLLNMNDCDALKLTCKAVKQVLKRECILFCPHRLESGEEIDIKSCFAFSNPAKAKSKIIYLLDGYMLCNFSQRQGTFQIDYPSIPRLRRYMLVTEPQTRKVLENIMKLYYDTMESPSTPAAPEAFEKQVKELPVLLQEYIESIQIGSDLSRDQLGYWNRAVNHPQGIGIGLIWKRPREWASHHRVDLFE